MGINISMKKTRDATLLLVGGLEWEYEDEALIDTASPEYLELIRYFEQ